MQWGRQHESDALRELECVLKKSIKRSGLWISESGVLGASPDGLVDDCVVEAKCPFKYKNVLLSEVLVDDKSYIIHYDKSSKQWYYNEEHEYYHQIQGQIHLTNSVGAYLVVWTPNECPIVKIPKSHSWSENLLRLEKFYFHIFIPHIIQK